MKRPPIVITNTDYKKLCALIEEQRRVNRRLPEALHDLVEELNRAEVKETAEIGANVITLGSQARVRDLETQELMEYTLVTPEEADIDEGRISILAPLGTAMLGYRAGDVFEWTVPSGIRTLKVEEVLQPEIIRQRQAA